MKIHEMIRKHRKERGQTQEELARYLGVSAPAVNKWEKGQSYPDITMLPVLAAYFNLSVDELLGYEPQLMKEDIKKLYHGFAQRFGNEPYELVKAECEEYIKKYHSCFPFLLQMAVLFMNHLQLAPDAQKLLEEIIELLDCVIGKSNDVQLAKEAVLVKGGCYLMMQKPAEVLDMLGGEIQAFPQEAEMQAQAYQMKGEPNQAKAALQVSMYQHLLTLIGDAAMFISWEQEPSKRAEEIIRRTQELIEVFQVEALHFNVIAQTYLAFAQYYCITQNTEEAVKVLEQYVKCVLIQKFPLELHGDSYFDMVEAWLSKLALGKEPPRGDEIVRHSILQSVAGNPMFECLKDNSRFKHLVKQLEDFCTRNY